MAGTAGVGNLKCLYINLDSALGDKTIKVSDINGADFGIQVVALVVDVISGSGSGTTAYQKNDSSTPITASATASTNSAGILNVGLNSAVANRQLDPTDNLIISRATAASAQMIELFYTEKSPRSVTLT